MSTAKAAAGAAGKGLAVGIGIALGVIVAVALMVRAIPNLFSTTEVDREHSVVLAELQDLSRFVAATGRFQTLIDVEEDADYLPDFIKGERVIFVAEGDVEGYVEFGGLAEDAITVSEDGKTVTVRVPEPQLSEADLDVDSSYVAARDRGVLDRLEDAVSSGSPTDDQELLRRAEDRLGEAAQQSDLREVARTNTRQFLEAVLGAAGFENVVVVFEEPVA